MYLDFFGMKEMPFNITPDPRFLFYSKQHRVALDHLMYGIHNRKGFIELTGEVGSGKTTLCRALLSNMPMNVRTALVLNPSLTETQLLRAILNDFGLQVKGRDRLAYIERLNEFLLEQTKEGGNVVLIIDEAQDLIPEVMEQIRLLSNLETDQHKLMQIILAGQPELHDRLARPELRQLRQRITVTCKLQPLDVKDSADYIAHRLSVSGALPEVCFDEDAVRMVYKHTVGTPRLINNVCDNALLAAYVAGTRVIGVPEIKKAIAHMESAL